MGHLVSIYLIIVFFVFSFIHVDCYAQPSDAGVYIIQKKLSETGYDIGQVDGIWREKTKAAIMEYQRKNGLPVTGRPDEATLQQLGFKVKVIPRIMFLEDPKDSNKVFCLIESQIISLTNLCWGNMHLGITPEMLNKIFTTKTTEQERNEAITKLFNERIYELEKKIDDPKANFRPCK